MNKHEIFIYLGPTLEKEVAENIFPDATYLPPVKCGDIIAATLTQAKIIVIIDGFFEQTAAVWHKEILFALEKGINVFGAGSMGALRAAELSQFGMRGFGEVCRAYQEGEIEDDDEVAVLHASMGEGYLPETEAMINIRSTIKKARQEGAIAAELANKILAAAKHIFFKQRTWAGIFAHFLPSEIAQFKAWLDKHGTVNQKAIDVKALLFYLKTTPIDIMKTTIRTHNTIFLSKLVDEIYCTNGLLSKKQDENIENKLLMLLAFLMKTVDRLEKLPVSADIEMDARAKDKCYFSLRILFSLNQKKTNSKIDSALRLVASYIIFVSDYLLSVSFSPSRKVLLELFRELKAGFGESFLREYRYWRKNYTLSLIDILNSYFICYHFSLQSLELFFISDVEYFKDYYALAKSKMASLGS
jgi:hypothetical protein